MKNVIKAHKSFKKEFKKQSRMAITAAIGFTIAYAWRNSVYDSAKSFVARLLDVVPNHYLTEVYTALFITVFGVALIFLTARLLRD